MSDVYLVNFHSRDSETGHISVMTCHCASSIGRAIAWAKDTALQKKGFNDLCHSFFLITKVVVDHPSIPKNNLARVVYDDNATVYHWDANTKEWIGPNEEQTNAT
ncbi:MAG: hypothetical protein GY832_11325 [Chloroflexi bacterium]|nr:hypothetical protein [Chloroflexota bacterium]